MAPQFARHSPNVGINRKVAPMGESACSVRQMVLHICIGRLSGAQLDCGHSLIRHRIASWGSCRECTRTRPWGPHKYEESELVQLCERAYHIYTLVNLQFSDLVCDPIARVIWVFALQARGSAQNHHSFVPLRSSTCIFPLSPVFLIFPMCILVLDGFG